MKKDLKFSETKLIASMREALAHARGKLTLKTTAILARTRRASSRDESFSAKRAAGGAVLQE